jgi:hypothetical protein
MQISRTAPSVGATITEVYAQRRMLRQPKLLLTLVALCASAIILHHANPKHRYCRNDKLGKARRRVLLTDIMFPNSMAAWRLTEIKGFIERYDTDIYVGQRVNAFAGVEFALDWQSIMESHHIKDYNALIFNPAYNVLDEINKLSHQPFSGTAFNGKWPGDYMLRLRKYANTAPSIMDYDAYHHIFLMAYENLQAAFPGICQQTQSIHLYPGGGFNIHKDPKSYRIQQSALLISTQSFISTFVKVHMPHNPLLEVFGGPLLPKGALPVLKPHRVPSLPLRVAFTSVGDIKEKGADLYVAIAEHYTKLFPRDGVVFYGIGNVPDSKAVLRMKPMPQSNLSLFYRDNVEIYMSLDRTDRLHGWPLGVEAMLQGCVLFTTDRFQLNAANRYNFGDEVTVVEEGNIIPALVQLHEYVSDRQHLAAHSAAIQSRVFGLFSYEQQMEPIFSAIDQRMDKSCSKD